MRGSRQIQPGKDYDDPCSVLVGNLLKGLCGRVGRPRGSPRACRLRPEVQICHRLRTGSRVRDVVCPVLLDCEQDVCLRLRKVELSHPDLPAGKVMAGQGRRAPPGQARRGSAPLRWRLTWRRPGRGRRGSPVRPRSMVRSLSPSGRISASARAMAQKPGSVPMPVAPRGPLALCADRSPRAGRQGAVRPPGGRGRELQGLAFMGPRMLKLEPD